MFLSKISASGNDFLVTHRFLEGDFSDVAKKLCDRHFGVGADGFIVLLPSGVADIRWLFYNSDGSEASMCGNGTRAAGLYAFLNGLAKESLSLETGAGIIELLVEGESVTSAFSRCEILQERIVEEGLEWMLIDTGVPHLTAFSEQFLEFPKEKLRGLRHKYNANVNIGDIVEGEVMLRTFERGVEDETLACGTGMAALFCHLQNEGRVSQSATIVPKSGEKLQFIKKEGKIFFKGNVRKIFDTMVLL